MHPGLWHPNLFALLLCSLPSLRPLFEEHKGHSPSLRFEAGSGQDRLGHTPAAPPPGQATARPGTPAGRGRRRADGGPMAVVAPHLASLVGQVCWWLRPGPSPAPPQAWGLGAEIPARAGRNRRRSEPAGRGHGASSDLDPREGGNLAERWVGPRQSRA